MVEQEIWRPIPGHDHYEISNHGRVKSTPRYQSVRGGGRALFPGKILTPVTGSKGHLQVALNRGKIRFVHQLVLEAFIGPRPKGLLGLHHDGNPTNNRLENLYWGTYSDNLRDAVRHGTHHNARKTHCKRGHLLDAVALRADGSVRQRYCSICHRDDGLRWKRARAKGGNWKLTAQQACAIAADGRAARLVAAEYGVTHTTVLRIRKHGYARCDKDCAMSSQMRGDA